MNWQRKKLTYDICIPPLKKNIALLNEKETKDYYDWYLKTISSRIDYLTDVCSEEMKISKKTIGFSPESLLIIWKWFLQKAETEKNDKGERQLDLQTEYIVRDIGMFVGELFCSIYDNIHWGYYMEPKTDFFVNRPLLMGFKDNCVSPPFDAVFEPIHMVGVQAAKILFNKSTDKDLYNVFAKWSEKAEGTQRTVRNH